jgi:transposase
MRSQGGPRGPQAAPVALSESQRAVLEAIVRRATSPQRAVTRARIVLQAAAGARNQEIGESLGLQRATVRRWRVRWNEARTPLDETERSGDSKALALLIEAVLADEARPGAPATYTAEQICQIVAIACEAPEESERPISQWSAAQVAAEAVNRQVVSQISARTVGRFLKSGRSQTPSLTLLVE